MLLLLWKQEKRWQMRSSKSAGLEAMNVKKTNLMISKNKRDDDVRLLQSSRILNSSSGI